MQAKISVIIPVHNTAKYLDRCMASVLGQTFADIEVILAENLSTDGSAELCDHYALRDSRVRVLHLDRAGQSHARNVALTVATAPVICFIDSDDYVDIDMLATLNSIMVKHNADMVCSNFAFVKGEEITINANDDNGSISVMDKEQATTAFLANADNWAYTSACTKLYQKSLFKNLKFPENRFFEDHAIMHQAAYISNKVVWLQRAFYYYVYNELSTTHTLVPQKIYDFFCADYDRYRFIEEHRQMLANDYARLVNIYAVRCFKHFRIFMRNRQSARLKALKTDMISSLSAMTWNAALDSKICRRLKIIKYAYPLFFLIHIAFRQK